MKKWIAAMLALALLLFGSVIGFDLFKKQKTAEFMAKRPVPQMPVEVVTVQSRDWHPYIAAIGLIEPRQGVVLSTSVSGLVSAIHFTSGQKVQSGQLLVELDRAVEQANLVVAESRLASAANSLERNQQLYQRNSVSKKALDDAQADYLALKAEVASLQAVIDRRQIRAPFTGIVGLREVNLGEYLQPGNEITRLQNLDSMQIRFIVPQKNLSQVSVGMELRIHTDAYPDRRFEGRITAIDSAVSRDSGVLHLQAEIPNSEALLRAGMYATVEVIQPLISDALVIPSRAINFSLYGEQVYVLVETGEGKNIQLSVQQRSIKVAERQGDWSWIQTGLSSNDRVVTSGQVRLRNGAQVRLVEDGVIPAAAPVVISNVNSVASPSVGSVRKSASTAK